MDEEIEALFDSLDGCACLDEAYGVNVVFTRDTIAEFEAAASCYYSCGVTKHQKVGAFSALVIKAAQPRKGDQRRDVIVIDFGSVRITDQRSKN